MKKWLNLFGAMVLALTVLWLAAEPGLLGSNELFQWRSALIQYSGILSLLLMSIAMVLALRLPLIEDWVQGMDKAYRLHKWLGIGGVSLGVVHWLFYQVPKWLVMSGVLEKPVKHTGEGPVGNLAGWQLWISEMRHLGLELGEKGFYLLLVLLVVSLWSVVKYKPFKLSHRLMAVAYLMIAVHSVLLIKRAYWGEPVYFVTLAVTAMGSLAALYSLLGLVGRGNRVAATAVSTRFLPETRLMELVVRPDHAWPGHRPGQFAYLRFAEEDPHPFTIVSASHAGELRFLIKELGDFTTGLYQRVKQGDPLMIEGPYGRLAFDLNQPQVWVAGGVGIASFFAVLEVLQTHQAHPAVHLFYCTRGTDSALVDELWSLARKARVSLSVIDTQVAPRLNTQQIAAKCGDLCGYEFYFCGPEAFSKTLKTELGGYRVNVEQHYHEELFVMR